MPAIFGSLLTADGTGGSASLTPLRAPAYVTYEGVLANPAVRYGPISGTTPSPIVVNSNGRKQRTSFEDWYYRIHFYPARFDFGNLVGRQQRALTVWNAFFNPVTLQSFNLVDGEGITVTQPVVPPYVMLPLKTLKYNVEISTEGPPVIDATAEFVIDGVQYDIPFTGRRIVVFPFKPNWAAAVEETLEWLTSLTITYSGKEQVSEIRVEPRRIMQFNVRIHLDDVNLFDNLVYGWGGRMFAMPLWQEKAKTTAPSTSGTNTVAAPTFAKTFASGGMAVLYRSSRDFEIIEIASATSTTITTARPLVSSWPAGVLVIPLMVGALDANVPTSRAADTHVDAVVRFVSIPIDNNPRIADTVAPLLYRGEELYTGETNWIAPLQVEMMTRETRVDGETGIFRLIKRAPFPLLTRGFSWLVKDKLAAEGLREFFGRRRGRFKPVWIPSGTRDFKLIEPATDAQSTIYVSNNEYGSLVNMQEARRDIVIIMRDGERICRRIDAYGVDEQGRGLLTLNAAVGRDLTDANIKKISYLGLYRLGSDSITFSWRTEKGAVVETNLVLKEPTL